MANNCLGYFQEITHLARLPCLRSLSLGDLHFGLNPLCKLCNYQTYILHHLKQLRYLDGVPITEEARSNADSTFVKKKMYYNMKIKTMHRNTTNEIQQVTKLKENKLAQLQFQIQQLVRAQKEIEKELEERKLFPADATNPERESDKKTFEMVPSSQMNLLFTLLQAIGVQAHCHHGKP